MKCINVHVATHMYKVHVHIATKITITHCIIMWFLGLCMRACGCSENKKVLTDDSDINYKVAKHADMWQLKLCVVYTILLECICINKC